MSKYFSYFLFQNFFSRTSVLFVGSLILLFYISGDVYSGFQSQGGFAHSCFITCLQYIPQNHVRHLLTIWSVSMAAESFDSYTCTHTQHKWDSNPSCIGCTAHLVCNAYFIKRNKRNKRNSWPLKNNKSCLNFPRGVNFIFSGWVLGMCFPFSVQFPSFPMLPNNRLAHAPLIFSFDPLWENLNPKNIIGTTLNDQKFRIIFYFYKVITT